jgi:integrase
MSAAKALVLEVETAVARGRRWVPPDEARLPVLARIEGGEIVEGLVRDFMIDRRRLMAAGTVRHYERALAYFCDHLRELGHRGRELPLALLTRETLASFWEELREDRSIATSRLYVGAIIGAWEWAVDSDRYGDHAPRVRRLVMPSPASRPVRAPTWAEMDAAIAAAHALALEHSADTRGRHSRGDSYAWRAQLYTVLRFTGLRVSQAMRLTWDDVDLENATVTVRGELGKSRAERSGRVIPISPHLVDELAGWGRREGWLLAPHKTVRDQLAPAASTLVWVRSGVDPRVYSYDAGDPDAHGPTHHAFRKGFKTGLAQLGVAAHVRDYLLGHHRGVDEHYLDSRAEARAAVAMIPPVEAVPARVALMLPR